MSKEVKINYNNTFATQHSRDYYRGASFHWSGEWMVGAHYLSDDYTIDYVVHGQVLLACAKSHLSTLENEPKDFIRDESGTVIGVVSTYWDFVLSGIVGKSPGIKIQDNYWYICKDTGVPEEEQVWENTGVKAKMELSDLTPEEIEILQRPGKEVVTEFVNNTMTQSTGQDPTKIMSQKATTDALNTKASNSALSAAIENEVLRANNAYQPKGDYATNTRVDGLQEELNTFKGETADNFDSVGDSLETLQDNIDSVAESIPTKVSELENDSNYQTKTNVETLLEPINAVIPQEATALNQLADKNFVTVSISDARAAFKGVSAAGLTEQEFFTWANSLTVDENDYVFWNTEDSTGNAILKRYYRSGSSWIYEYTLNNNSFTAAEWLAIKSGITADMIPSQASASNQLADKAFVNSSIATSTANFRGTSAAGLTEAQFLTWANGLTHDENDYVYWNTVDSVGNVVFKRYKYSGNSWVYEYDLNNSSFTANEWAAIQSGITSDLVTKLTNLPTNADLTAALNNKVDKVAGKQLSTEDYTTVEKTKLGRISTILTNIQPEVEAWTGPSPGEATTHVYVSGINSENGMTSTIDLVDYLVPKDDRTNYTAAEKTKLAGIASGAEVNVQSDWNVSDTSSDAFIKNKPENLVQDANYVHTDNNYTTTEKTKLSGVAEGAQVNVLEGVKVDGTELTITDKKVDIDLSGKVNVASHQSQEDQSFVFRQTGDGNLTIDAKNAELTSIKGKTLVWNQLVRLFSSTSRGISCAFDSATGVATFSGQGDGGSSSIQFFLGLNTISSHKYLLLIDDIDNSGIRIQYSDTTIPWLFFYGIAFGTAGARAVSVIDTATSSSTNLARFTFAAQQPSFSYRYRINIFDLTIMFGAGNEPSSVAEFEALYPGYHEYTPGTLVSNDAEAVETTGVNQWDEEWEDGYIDVITGNLVGSTTYRRNKNTIKVFPSTAYYLKGTNFRLYFYDANGSYISYLASQTNTIFSTPANAYLMRFYSENANIEVGAVCINLSNPAINGQYFPYWKRTQNLGLNSLKVKSHNIWDEECTFSSTIIRSANFIPCTPSQNYYLKAPNNNFTFYFYNKEKEEISQTGSINYNSVFTTPEGAYYMKFADGSYGTTYNHDICINLSSSFNGQYEPYGDIVINGLKSAGSVYDEIVRNKYIKRIGEVDLGTSDWGVYESTSPVFYAPISNAKLYTSSMGAAPQINTKGYVSVYAINSATDKSITVNTSGQTTGRIYIKDSVYTDATAFKTAMSGVMLYYELATPVEYELAEPIRTDYKVDKLGTERVISDTVPTPPFRADITYHEANIKDIEVEGITEYLKREELTDELDKLDSIEEGAQENKIEHIQINGTEQTITNKTVNLPAYPTTLPASDVSAWAKAATKPSYNFSEIGGSVANSQLPSSISIENIAASGQLSGNAFKVIAEHIAKLTSRIEALENGIGVTDTLTSNSVDSANGYYINGDKTVIIGSGAPTVVPAFAGQFYINTSGPALYYAVNNSATTDWKQA